MIQKKDGLLCDRCKKEIRPDTAYCSIGASIVLWDPSIRTPNIFTCIEQQINYAKTIEMHPQCWIDTLRDHGIELIDIDNVYKEKKDNINKEGGDNGMEQTDTN